jgi:hypothetical protein
MADNKIAVLAVSSITPPMPRIEPYNLWEVVKRIVIYTTVPLFISLEQFYVSNTA